MGYDLKGKYDPSTGRITIPVNKVIGKNNSGEAITIYNLTKASNYSKFSTDPVVATISDNEIIFADGFYAKVPDGGGYVWMNNVAAKEANGMMKISRIDFNTLKPTTNYEYPVYVAKFDDKHFTVLGFSQWLYSHKYDVKFNIQSAKQATITTTTTPVDFYHNPTTNVDQIYNLLYRNVDTVNKVSNNPSFVVDTTGGKTTLTTVKKLFEAYKDGTTWRGFLTGNFELVANFNIIKAPVENCDTIDGIRYKCDPEAKTAIVLGAEPTTTALNIKDKITYNGVECVVNTINESAFASNKTVKSVTIPASITNIGNNAFYSSGINELHIASLEAWCKINFFNNNANPLCRVYSSASAVKTGKVFIGEEPLGTTITIPASIKSIPDNCFAYMRPVKKYVLPEGLTSLGYRCFYQNDSLVDINLPSTLTSIDGSFYNCGSLESIDIPGGVEILTKEIFNACRKLKNVGLHHGLKAIYQYAFYGCSGLTELTFPSTLDSIGSSVFSSAKNITKLTCRAITPPAVSADAVFSPFAANCVLYVPEESIAAYKAAPGWKNFSAIEKDNSGITDLEDEDAQVAPVYYNLQGMKVANPASGIYIEKRGNKTRKVVIKK